MKKIISRMNNRRTLYHGLYFEQCGLLISANSNVSFCFEIARTDRADQELS